MDYYFTDRKFNVLGIASTDGDGHWHVSADSEVQSTDDRPAVALTLTIPFQTDQEQAIDEMAAENNFVLYQDEQGDGHQMVIASINHDTLTHIHTVVCTDAGNDLMNVVVNSYKADKAYTIADYILRFTSGSGWEIGTNDFTGNTRTLEWDDTDTALNRIKSVADDFGTVLSFGFSFVGTTVVRRVINIKQEDTTDSNVFFYINKDINNLVKSVDIYDMETAVYGTGATPDGSYTPINLAGYSWSDPNGRYVLGGDGVLRDTVAVQQYSYLISNGNPTPTSGHWERFKSFDSNSQAALLQAVLADLKQHNHPNVNYQIDLVNAPYVPLNQTVHIADENQNLFLSAKVLSIERSRAEHYTKITLGDYLTETSQVDAQLQAMADQIKNIPKTVQYYPWIRYADDDQGTNMSAFPANKKYMAVVYRNKSSVPSDNPADYAGQWALIQGKDGDDGVPGAKGADGRTSYFHTAWADDVSGQSGFTVSGGDGKKYIGTYSDFTQADSTNPSDYNWALFKGPQGDVGPKGPQGPQGVPGSKDVPYTYIQLGTPTSPKKGDLWWHGTTLNDATALQYYNGSTWIDQSIQQAILNIEKLVAIEIDSATINSPDINAPFHHTALSDANKGNFSSGNTSMQYGHVNITGNVENDQGTADGHMLISDLGPSGLISRERTPDNAGDTQYANLQGGKLNLSTLISAENAATKKYVFSTFKSTDNVTYYYNNTTAYSNADIQWAYINYARRNNICTVSFDVVAKGKQGWLDLAQPRTGYKPYLAQATGATLFSTSYIGATCAVYYVKGGYWRLIPSVGSGEYRGSFSYITQDDYPTGDPFF
ncbi:phage tail spike protein [Lacticaseibacillus paracasei]|uniref:phage tail spike protein n=1 Tax=Lacticaseibacillus paracasei TaxID=1597 RepID=UPI0018A39032|nr:phage tail spike protein [Lacticaseibacillus paracasei]QOP46954.1 phage tail protein [Lacticaseibacillus paracasei]